MSWSSVLSVKLLARLFSILFWNIIGISPLCLLKFKKEFGFFFLTLSLNFIEGLRNFEYGGKLKNKFGSSCSLSISFNISKIANQIISQSCSKASLEQYLKFVVGIREFGFWANFLKILKNV